ncbi:aldolase catalytic domain-containing protein [Haloferula sp. A504]|uniref:aldolase catalytic domain-containing protein n=1 Tax=Haloferula sp. A504 TaxID=3373601 RepID=UPI0031CB8A78|nr:aldolase catalytic domain-containing protein [Verrucomicrobiaceae bacterium E54]
MSEKAPWITYRPELKVLDCTIRDGGLINDSNFTDDQVRAVYRACIDAGIDTMEIGYKNSPQQFPKDRYGPWRHCEEEDMRRVVGDHDSEATGLRLCAMADAGGKSDWKHQIIPAKDSVLDMIRVACYIHQISEAMEMIERFDSLGYETTLNIMAISTVADSEIDQGLRIAAKSPVGTVVVVDSYGNLYREQIDHLMRKYAKALKGTGKEVGIHAHNNLQLAFANTIEAIILGSNRVDATMMGLGRGAGNCPMEILLSFLRNPKFKLRPVLEVIENTILPIREKCDWGPSIPYHLTGRMNLHPRSAMAFREGPTPDAYTAFYDQTMSDL